MRTLLAFASMLLALTANAQWSNSYADVDQDGCVGVGDVLEVLSLFGECNTQWQNCGDTLQYDGYWYETVLIGDQCWFAENLRTTVYANGDSIPSGLTYGFWTSTSSGATAVYGEGSGNCYNYSPIINACDEAQSLAEYGRLYNWYAVDDARNLCPIGWHVPTMGEWSNLFNFISAQGFSGAEGIAMKSTYGWYASGNGTDDFGFSALPGGYRFFDNGNFFTAGKLGRWWSSSPNGDDAWTESLYYDDLLIAGYYNPRNGYSVRCLRGVELQGCTNSSYLEYNMSATIDDGSCTTLIVEGCTDLAYVEYNALANADDGSCTTLIVEGCTYQAFIEYDASANVDDGSCTTLIVEGCTDSTYVEYNASANVDDGSCTTIAPTCVSPSMDGYSYNVVEIGDQCWFAENLRTTVYANGDTIPASLTDAEWTSTTLGATAVYGEGSSPCSHTSPSLDACDEAQSLVEYGRLYNWYAVDDTRNLCPSGWHVPTDGEWTDLDDFVAAQGFSETAGTALKTTYGWNQQAGGTNGTDDFGFSVVPHGLRNHSGYAQFVYAGNIGSIWSSSLNGSNAWYRAFSYNSYSIIRDSQWLHRGFAVRCLKDAG